MKRARLSRETEQRGGQIECDTGKGGGGGEGSLYGGDMLDLEN